MAVEAIQYVYVHSPSLETPSCIILWAGMTGEQEIRSADFSVAPLSLLLSDDTYEYMEYCQAHISTKIELVTHS